MSNASRQRQLKKWNTKVHNKFFADYDERGYYPTLEFKFVRDETGHLIGALQLFRLRDTEGVAEWRECPIIDLPKIPG